MTCTGAAGLPWRPVLQTVRVSLHCERHWRKAEVPKIHFDGVLAPNAKLLKRLFEPGMAHGPNCGGELEIVAAILEAPVIEKIITHLGPPARASPRAPA